MGTAARTYPASAAEFPKTDQKVWALACEIGSVTHAEDPSEDGQEKASTMELGVGTAGNSPPRLHPDSTRLEI